MSLTKVQNLSEANALLLLEPYGENNDNPTMSMFIDEADGYKLKAIIYDDTQPNNKRVIALSVGTSAQDIAARVRSTAFNPIFRNNSFNPIPFTTADFDTDNLFDASVTASGTATSGGATTLTDAGASFTPNALIGQIVIITGGTGADQVRRIIGNTATELTVGTWSTNPDATSDYEISIKNRLTIPDDADDALKYLLCLRTTFSANTVGDRGMAIYVNGSFMTSGFMSTTNTAVECMTFLPSCIMELNAGDYVEIDGYQSSGGDLTGLAVGDRIYMSLISHTT